MLTLEMECDETCGGDEAVAHYQAFNSDPINNSDPSGLAATRSYLAGSETTDFHTTKEIAVLPDGSRQATYRLFLGRTNIVSAGVGAPGQTFRSEEELTHVVQAFSGDRATQLESLVDKAVATRVDSLNQMDSANATVDNMKFGFGLVPFFSAVDHYRRGEPWKLDAALSALVLAPAVSAALKSVLATGAAASAVAAEGGEAQALVHLTDAAGVQGIGETGTIIGEHGIFALPESAAGQSTLTKVIRSGLMPARTAEAVPIPAGAQGLFQRPIPVGLFSGWKYFSGVRFAPAGTISTASGEFITGSSLIGPRTLIYGPDLLINGTATGLTGLYLYEAKRGTVAAGK
ncbi:MAG TPA: hypothetical protein VIM11_09315 [Tepidisphaeraceae bacterium]|jgi:hypothetical protein